jgi:hypothetical protein
MNTETFILPAHWGSALINNDYSGLCETDKLEISYFLATNDCPDFVAMSDETYYIKHNDAGTLPCEVAEFTAFI